MECNEMNIKCSICEKFMIPDSAEYYDGEFYCEKCYVLLLVDIPPKLWHELKCSQCDNLLNRSPVYLLHDGSGLCCDCYIPGMLAIRNFMYEKIAQMLHFPCKYYYLGCNTIFLYGNGTQEYSHEDICPFRKRKCIYKFKGCTYEDIEQKCRKHEWYFCRFSEECRLCDRTSILEDSLFTHYNSAHQMNTFLSGSYLRASNGEKIYLISCAAGLSVCNYFMDDTEINLYIYIPIPSSQLDQYKCKIQLINSETNDSLTFTPTLEVNIREFANDWHVRIERNQFTWSIDCGLDISVDITKI